MRNRGRGRVPCKRVLLVAISVLGAFAASGAFASDADAADLTVYMQGSLTSNGAGWGTVDETTSANLMNCTYPASTSCTASYGFGWVVELQASAPPGWRFSHWTEGGSGQVNCDNGTADNVCRFQLWFDNLYISAHFVDETAPDAAINSGPSGPINFNNPSWSFSSPDADTYNPVTFTCRWEDLVRANTYNYGCNGGTFNPAGWLDGGYVLTVIARDGSGNTDASPPSRSITIDTAPPNTAITSGPSGTTSSTSAGFYFTGSDGGTGVAGFECKLDTGAWVGCSSPHTYTGLSFAEHTFSVRARDAATNLDGTPATRTWTVADTTPPDTTITSGPPAGTVTHVANHFYFSSSEPGSTFQFRRDGGAWQNWANNNVSHLYCTGQHTFDVRAVDAAGNVDPTPASRTWTVFLVDLDGNCVSDVGVFRPSNGTWRVQGMPIVYFGQSSDVPVPGHYDADPAIDIAVFRPSNGGWYVQGSPTVYFGSSGDVPVPADYNGDGKTDFAVWRPSNGGWYVRDAATVYYGRSGDVPVPQDYDYDGDFDRAVWRPSNGGWYVHGRATSYWGQAGDVPVPAHYNRRYVTEPPDFGVWRPASGAWLLRNEFAGLKTQTFYWGLNGDIPVPGEFDGGGNGDMAVFRPSNGTWYIRNIGTVAWGQSGDIPLR
jgi:hypothetical protein